MEYKNKVREWGSRSPGTLAFFTSEGTPSYSLHYINYCHKGYNNVQFVQTELLFQLLKDKIYH